MVSFIPHSYYPRRLKSCKLDCTGLLHECKIIVCRAGIFSAYFPALYLRGTLFNHRTKHNLYYRLYKSNHYS